VARLGEMPLLWGFKDS